jgi:hypothetical protein
MTSTDLTFLPGFTKIISQPAETLQNEIWSFKSHCKSTTPTLNDSSQVISVLLLGDERKKAHRSLAFLFILLRIAAMMTKCMSNEAITCSHSAGYNWTEVSSLTNTAWRKNLCFMRPPLGGEKCNRRVKWRGNFCDSCYLILTLHNKPFGLTNF